MTILSNPSRMAGDDERFLRWTMLALLAVTSIRLAWLQFGRLDLYPDEAQYWLWSLTPDWGYYSKPPLLAWIIRLTTALCGDSETGVRLASPLLHCAASVIVYRIARLLYDVRIACWSAIAYATLPGISFSSLIISTDVPLLLCWAAALYAFLCALEASSWRWWIAVGIAAGLGLLAKYAMAYWLLSALLFLLIAKEERRHLPRFFAAAALALAIYSPNFFWNAAHGYVSYHHTEANANIDGFALHPGAFGEFAGSQFGVFGPIFFAALLVIVVFWPRSLAERRAQILAVFALPTLAMMLAVSLLSRAHPNWSAPAYVSATILVVAFLIERGRVVLVAASVALHVAAAILLIETRDIAQAAGWNMPGQYDPVHRLRGWAALARGVDTLRLQDPGAKILSDNREVLASLIYYLRPHPFDALKWNPGHGVHDQFDLSADIKDHIGEDVIFVSPRSQPVDVPSYFAETGSIGHVVVPLGGNTTREFLLMELNGFKGY